MSEYTPDCWVVVKISSPEETTYRLLCGWYGGYLGSNSWKMSSGITKVIKHEDHYEIHNHSGSIYHCGKEVERMSGYTMSIFSSFAEQQTDSLKFEHIEFKDMIL